LRRRLSELIVGRARLFVCPTVYVAMCANLWTDPVTVLQFCLPGAVSELTICIHVGAGGWASAPAIAGQRVAWPDGRRTSRRLTDGGGGGDRVRDTITSLMPTFVGGAIVRLVPP